MAGHEIQQLKPLWVRSITFPFLTAKSPGRFPKSSRPGKPASLTAKSALQLCLGTASSSLVLKGWLRNRLLPALTPTLNLSVFGGKHDYRAIHMLTHLSHISPSIPGSIISSRIKSGINSVAVSRFHRRDRLHAPHSLPFPNTKDIRNGLFVFNN